MAKIKNWAIGVGHGKFAKMHEVAEALGESNDCGVKAVALTTDSEYATVHAAMQAAGRKPRRGTWLPQIQEVIRDLGFRMVEMNPRDIIDAFPGQHKNLKSLTTHHPERFAKQWPDGRYMMLVSGGGHIVAIVDGYTMDWTERRPMRCKRLWKVEAV